MIDFKAAFRYILHALLLATLNHLGLPRWFQQVTSPYDQNRCLISSEGKPHARFDMGDGIRQGCPLKPILFMLAIGCPTAVTSDGIATVHQLEESYARIL